MRNQPIRIFAHLEKIRFFTGFCNRRAAIRTLAVNNLRLCKKGLAGRTIPPLIASFINISLFIKFLKNILYGTHMFRIRCTNKFIIACPHQIPYPPDLSRYLIHIGLRRNSRRFRVILYFLAVLVGSGQKKYIISNLTFEPSERIGHNHLIGVAEMWLSGTVCDCRRNVKLSFIVHF